MFEVLTLIIRAVTEHYLKQTESKRVGNKVLHIYVIPLPLSIHVTYFKWKLAK